MVHRGSLGLCTAAGHTLLASDELEKNTTGSRIAGLGRVTLWHLGKSIVQLWAVATSGTAGNQAYLRLGLCVTAFPHTAFLTHGKDRLLGPGWRQGFRPQTETKPNPALKAEPVPWAEAPSSGSTFKDQKLKIPNSHCDFDGAIQQNRQRENYYTTGERREAVEKEAFVN